MDLNQFYMIMSIQKSKLSSLKGKQPVDKYTYTTVSAVQLMNATLLIQLITVIILVPDKADFNENKW